MKLTNKKKPFIPNFFILGAAKCGTTSLHAYLSRMPDICMSKPKEPFFFEAEFEKGLEFYQIKYFSHWKGESIIGDARHRNLYLPYIPQRIKQVSINAKFVVIVRNPIDRAFSHWNHRRYHNVETLSFEDTIQEDLSRLQIGLSYGTLKEILEHTKRMLETAESGAPPYYRTFLDSGYYYNQVQRYYALFPEKNIKIILLEDLIAKPKDTINGLIKHLGIDPNRNRFKQVIHENMARKRDVKGSLKYKIWKLTKSAQKRDLLPGFIWRILRSRLEPKIKKLDMPRMNDTMRAWLREHYQEHNEMFSKLINRDLSHWI